MARLRDIDGDLPVFCPGCAEREFGYRAPEGKTVWSLTGPTPSALDEAGLHLDAGVPTNC